MEGLTTDEAARRLDEHGENRIEEDDKTTALDVFARQFKNFLIWILIGAAVASLLAGKMLTFYFIIIIIGIIALMGFIQEWKAEEAMEELESMTTPIVTALRNGEKVEINSTEIVPGDVLKLEMGDKIPADAKIIKQNDLRVNEAILTGESKAVSKTEDDTVYSGTTIVHGRATVKVTETAMDTELGKIADEIQQEEEETPLQKRIDSLGKKLAITAIGVCSGIFVLGVSQGSPVDTVLIVALALIVATVPEALPLTLTLTLSAGMRDMAKRNAIVKKMLAVEALGSTTVICTDKTGTLTRNEMTVRKLYFNGEEADVDGTGYIPQGSIKKKGHILEAGRNRVLAKMAETSLLCNNSDLLLEDGNYELDGEPTEGAMLVLGEKTGLKKKNLENEMPREEEILFTSERKMMTTVNKDGEKYTAFTKGAPEVVLEKCSHIMLDGEIKELDDTTKDEIIEKNQEFASDALRVLGLAYREDVEKPFNEENTEKNLVFLGLAGMIDPPRKEVKEAIATCENAGIQVKMVTGDNPVTAKAVADELELTDNPDILTGEDLEKMDEEELEEKVPEVDIYARTRPEQKLHIVNALKEDGEVVAMTGDGVNDAPAVKKADVGIGMGQNGTDVTRESSDMILKDDNFSTIVTAIKDGRRIYDNIEKFTTYLLSRNFTEILIIALGIVFLGFEFLPLIALQILFINVIGEETPAISLGLDPATEGIMEREPRDPERGILNPRNTFLVVSMAIFMSVTGFLVFLMGNPTQNIELARTMAFASIVLMVIVHAFNFRSLTNSLFQINLLENKYIIGSIGLVTPLMIASIHWPVFAKFFDHIALNSYQWGIAASGAIATLGFIEGIKYIGKTYFEE